jgi:hypothetical protein
LVKPALELVLQQVEHRPPVHAGGLHPDHRHGVAAKPTISGFDLADLDQDTAGDLTVFAGASSGMLNDDDDALAATEIEPGSVHDEDERRRSVDVRQDRVRWRAFAVMVAGCGSGGKHRQRHLEDPHADNEEDGEREPSHRPRGDLGLVDHVGCRPSAAAPRPAGGDEQVHGSKLRGAAFVLRGCVAAYT